MSKHSLEKGVISHAMRRRRHRPPDPHAARRMPAHTTLHGARGRAAGSGLLGTRCVATRCVCGRAMELAPTHTKRASALPEARHPPILFSIKGIKFKLVGLLTLGRPCMR